MGVGWDKWHGSTRRTAPAQEPFEAKRVIHGWSSGRRVNKVITQYQVFPLASAGVSLIQVQPQLQLGPRIDDTSRESEAEQHVATRYASALALRHAQLMTTIASALAASPTSACSRATLLNTSNKHRQHQQHCIARRPRCHGTLGKRFPAAQGGPADRSGEVLRKMPLPVCKMVRRCFDASGYCIARQEPQDR